MGVGMGVRWRENAGPRLLTAGNCSSLSGWTAVVLNSCETLLGRVSDIFPLFSILSCHEPQMLCVFEFYFPFPPSPAQPAPVLSGS